MKPIKQTKLHDPPNQHGNCLRACYASVLEIPIDSIPEFEEMDEKSWWPAELKWANTLGLQLICFDGEYHFEGYYFLAGKSPRGDFNHIVVYENGQMVHDPHPDGTGIESVDNTYIFLPHDPARVLKAVETPEEAK